jgi:hypothetical protein
VRVSFDVDDTASRDAYRPPRVAAPETAVLSVDFFDGQAERGADADGTNNVCLISNTLVIRSTPPPISAAALRNLAHQFARYVRQTLTSLIDGVRDA